MSKIGLGSLVLPSLAVIGDRDSLSASILVQAGGRKVCPCKLIVLRKINAWIYLKSSSLIGRLGKLLKIFWF